MHMIMTFFSVNFSYFVSLSTGGFNAKKLQNLHAVLLAINR